MGLERFLVAAIFLPRLSPPSEPEDEADGLLELEDPVEEPGGCPQVALLRPAAPGAEGWKKEALGVTVRKCSKIPASFPGAAAPSLGKYSRLQEDPKVQEEGSLLSGDTAMASYKVQVATGQYWGSGTFDAISITLVGAKGESGKQLLDNVGKDFVPGAVDEFKVSCGQDLGPLLLVRLHKDPYLFFPEDSWYCSFVQLTSPQGEVSQFPCYQWIEGYQSLELREGTGKLACDDIESPLLLRQRVEEVKARQDSYRWAEFVPGMPRCLAVESIEEMDTNVKFSLTKLGTFILRSNLTKLEMKLKGFMSCQESWKRLEDIRKVFWFNKTPVSEYVADHWMEDAFFGYQYLNGVNPAVIQQCTEIPAHFPVTQAMVAGSLGESATLKEELQKGNIFIVDYKILQHIPTNTIQGQKQYMTAPLCLLHQTPSGDLCPVAIQLSQTPGPKSPIFLPSDPVWDWTLAKMWVRNADFHVHQNISHLLRTHLLAEVFAMATLRQLPMCHPLFKLLIPHFRYTLQINALARVRLIKKGGMMDQYDFGSWIPNSPPSMRRPPPTMKGTATLESILETIPQVNITCIALSSLWLLSNEAGDRRPLGDFPDEHFIEEEPKRLIKAFQNRLAEISEEIDERNKSLPLPYNYINPPQIENSIAI
ncbi:hypothetical protein lerEdw1_010197 [Lerista edwardsae]|nr:hypothetical protein lerEdw1_010197 [Lerista edwardsae]